MSETTIRLLLKALTEELDAQKLKPQYRLTDEEPMQVGEWCRRDQAQKAFGISPHRLRQLVIDRKVIAKKFDPDAQTSVVVFRTSDIRRAIDEMPNYMYDVPANNTKGE